jgi:hypothetical protein
MPSWVFGFVSMILEFEDILPLQNDHHLETAAVIQSNHGVNHGVELVS